MRGNEARRRSESCPRPHSDLQRIYEVRKDPGSLSRPDLLLTTLLVRRDWEQDSSHPHVLPSPCSQRAWAAGRWKPRLPRQASVSSLSRHPRLRIPNPHVLEKHGKWGGPGDSVGGEQPPAGSFVAIPP